LLRARHENPGSRIALVRGTVFYRRNHQTMAATAPTKTTATVAASTSAGMSNMVGDDSGSALPKDDVSRLATD
jgi:hypothetical protein